MDDAIGRPGEARRRLARRASASSAPSCVADAGLVSVGVARPTPATWRGPGRRAGTDARERRRARRRGPAPRRGRQAPAAQLRGLRRAAMVPARCRVGRAVVAVAGAAVGVAICEDVWVDDGPARSRSPGRAASLLVVLNASPYYAGPARASAVDVLPRRAAETGLRDRVRQPRRRPGRARLRRREPGRRRRPAPSLARGAAVRGGAPRRRRGGARRRTAAPTASGVATARRRGPIASPGAPSCRPPRRRRGGLRGARDRDARLPREERLLARR